MDDTFADHFTLADYSVNLFLGYLSIFGLLPDEIPQEYLNIVVVLVFKIKQWYNW